MMHKSMYVQGIKLYENMMSITKKKIVHKLMISKQMIFYDDK